MNQFYRLNCLEGELIQVSPRRISICIVVKLLGYNGMLAIEHPDLQGEATCLRLLRLPLRKDDTAVGQVNLHTPVRQPENDCLFLHTDVLDEDWRMMLLDLRDRLEV